MRQQSLVMEQPICREVRCADWAAFRTLIASTEFRGSDDEWVFRGHADTLPNGAQARWRLQSQWERRQEENAARHRRFWRRELIEGHNYYRGVHLGRCFESFKASLGPAAVNDDNLAVEAIGRHFGLLTDLLDWTIDPLRAAFFAFEKYVSIKTPGIENGGNWMDAFPPDVDALIYLRAQYSGVLRVWALRNPADLQQSSPDRNWQSVRWTPDRLQEEPPHEREFTYINRQWPTNHQMYDRIRAQRGVFTRLESQRSLDLETYLVQNNKLNHLTMITIEGRAALEALPNLQEEGINYSVLYPGPEGAARQANLGRWFNG